MARSAAFISIIVAINVLISARNIYSQENQETFNSSLTLFEGDIAGIDANSILASLGDKIARNGIANEAQHWQGGHVPYEISSQFNSEQRKSILRAMKGFQNSTCIKFFERIDEEDYLHISPGRGCWSHVGRIGSKQFINLHPTDCLTNGIIQHELMHTLGFLHEQSRIDRDDYVEIFTNNIQSVSQRDFMKYTDVNTSAFGQEYDFDSIMHYGTNDSAINPSMPTIQPKEQYRSKKIGQRNRLSDIDVRKINLMYKCTSHTEIPKTPCTCVTRVEIANVTSTVPPQIKQLESTVPPPVLSIISRSHIESGGVLLVGDEIWSPNQEARLFMQHNGEAVVYRACDNQIIWSSATGFIVRSPVSLQMQTDGNLIFKQFNGEVVWRSGTSGNAFAGASLRVDDDGSLCIFRTGACLWRSGGAPVSCQPKLSPSFSDAKVILASGDSMRQGNVAYSVEYTCKLIIDGSGSLILSRVCDGAEVWSALNGRSSPYHGMYGQTVLSLYEDTENLVLEVFPWDGSGAFTLWSTTWATYFVLPNFRSSAADLRLRNDCQMCLYKDGSCRWTASSVMTSC